MDWGGDPMNVDYGKIYAHRYDVLRLACERGWDRERGGITAFREAERAPGCRTTRCSWRSSAASA